MSKYVRLDIQEEGLVENVVKAMTLLGIPDPIGNSDLNGKVYVPTRKEFHYLTGITQEEILDVDVYPMFNGPEGERGHPDRVAIIGAGISKMLDFDRDSRVEFFLLGLAHDLGKLKVDKAYYPENNPYARDGRKYREYMEKFKHNHILSKNLPTHWGLRVTEGAGGSHMHQSGKCRNKPYFDYAPKTPEGFVLSQLIAISDFIDAITARPCRKNGKYHRPKEIIDLTINEYGSMKIQYEGNLYPKIDIGGKEIIHELQRKGYIARHKPINVSEEDFRMNPFDGLNIK